MAAGSGFLGALVGLAGPIALKAMAALGFSTVTYLGVQALVDSLVSSAQTYWSQMPASVLQLSTLSGIPTGLGMVFATYAALFAIRAASGFKKYVLK